MKDVLGSSPVLIVLEWLAHINSSIAIISAPFTKNHQLLLNSSTALRNCHLIGSVSFID